MALDRRRVARGKRVVERRGHRVMAGLCAHAPQSSQHSIEGVEILRLRQCEDDRRARQTTCDLRL
jgi:hypothetical protein